MTQRTITVDGIARTVDADGPAGAPAALVLDGGAGVGRGPDTASVTRRLVSSGLEVFVVDAAVPGGVTAHEDAVALIDELGLHWVNLVGIGAGAATAWQVAARHFGKASSLVVLDHGHPAVPGPDADADPTCPAVEVATTLVLVDGSFREAAYATGRRVFSDYRVVELTDTGHSTASRAGAGRPRRGQGSSGAAGGDPLAAAFASEIVLRSSPW